jgi:hypothetical protein
VEAGASKTVDAFFIFLIVV